MEHHKKLIFGLTQKKVTNEHEATRKQNLSRGS